MGEFIKKLSDLKEFTLDLLYPKYCIGCGVEGCYICQRCLRKLPYLSPLNCPKCGLPLGSRPFCPRCEEVSALGGLDSLHSVFRFEGLLRRAVHLLKYNNFRALAPVLAEQACSFLKIGGMRADVIIPVPLHPLRIRERGYNQSSLMAGELGKLTGIPTIEGYLVRTVNTPPQVRTSNRDERVKNVQEAFTCTGTELTGKSVIIFDDVCTTGSTLNACAAALKDNLVKGVYGLTLAREV